MAKTPEPKSILESFSCDFTGLKPIALWVSFIPRLLLFMPQFSHLSI